MYATDAPSPMTTPTGSTAPAAAPASRTTRPADDSPRRDDPPARGLLTAECERAEHHPRGKRVEDEREHAGVESLQRCEEQPGLRRVADRAEAKPDGQRPRPAPRRLRPSARAAPPAGRRRRASRPRSGRTAASASRRRRHRRACRRSPSPRTRRRTAGTERPPDRLGHRQAVTLPSAAALSAAMSSLRIANIASIARRPRSGSGSFRISSQPVGTTCHDRPNRSLSQPHCWALASPPAVSRLPEAIDLGLSLARRSGTRPPRRT